MVGKARLFPINSRSWPRRGISASRWKQSGCRAGSPGGSLHNGVGRVSVGVCQREAGSPGAGGVRSGRGEGWGGAPREMGVVSEATLKKKSVSV